MHLDITTRDYKTLKYLLNAYLPGTTVWAFGSRVKFTSKLDSDLDLVAFIEPVQESSLAELKDAFAESDLPFKVDILDWTLIPDNFKQNIQKDYVVVKDEDGEKESIPANWKKHKLGEFASINPKVTLKQEQEYSFVEMRDLDPNFKYVSPSAKRKFKSGSKFNNGDTLFARITPCLENGKISQVKNLANGVGFGSTEFLVFRGNENLSDNDFVYYLTRSADVRNRAIQAMTGTSGRQRVEKTALEKIEIIAPDFPSQQSIAKIITTIDDKIELNQQMNQTLENTAEAIFNEWFVNFNFPGFDGELLDKLPKGWRIGVISDIYKTTSGGTPSRAKDEFYADGTVKWVKSKELNSGFILDTEEKITENAVKNSSAKKFPRHSLLIAMYGATVGEYAIVSSEATCNQAICAIIPNDIYPYSYILEYIKVNKENIINQASGSAQQNISQALIQRQEILIPTSIVVKAFHEIAGTLLDRIENNLFENQILVQIRDNLLPRFMTGKIEVTT